MYAPPSDWLDGASLDPTSAGVSVHDDLVQYTLTLDAATPLGLDLSSNVAAHGASVGDFAATPPAGLAATAPSPTLSLFDDLVPGVTVSLVA